MIEERKVVIEIPVDIQMSNEEMRKGLESIFESIRSKNITFYWYLADKHEEVN